MKKTRTDIPKPFLAVLEYDGEKTPYVKEIQKRRKLSLERLMPNQKAFTCPKTKAPILMSID